MKDSGRKVPKGLIDQLFEALGGAAEQVTVGPLQNGNDEKATERWIAFWDQAEGSWMRAEIDPDITVGVVPTGCICKWIAQPIEEQTEYEQLGVDDRLLKTTSRTEYTREIVHTINLDCTKHAHLLRYDALGMGGMDQQAHAVAEMPEPAVNTEGLRRTRAENVRDAGYEILVEEGGVVSRGVVKDWSIEDAKAAQAKYDLRKASNSTFFMPLDHPFGEGHCRSCHHDCRFEHFTADDQTCQYPTCGHTFGCPGC